MTHQRPTGTSFGYCVFVALSFSAACCSPLLTQDRIAREEHETGYKNRFLTRPQKHAMLKVSPLGKLHFSEEVNTLRYPVPYHLLLAIDKNFVKHHELEYSQFERFQKRVIDAAKAYDKGELKDEKELSDTVSKLEGDLRRILPRKKLSGFRSASASGDFYRFGPLKFAKMYGATAGDLSMLKSRLPDCKKQLIHELDELGVWAIKRCNRGVSTKVLRNAKIDWETLVKTKRAIHKADIECFSVSSVWTGAKEFLAGKSKEMGTRYLVVAENGSPYIKHRIKEQVYLNLVELVTLLDMKPDRRKFLYKRIAEFREEYYENHERYKKDQLELGARRAAENVVKAREELASRLFKLLSESEDEQLKRLETIMFFRVKGPGKDYYNALHLAADEDEKSIEWDERKKVVEKFVDELKDRALAIEKKTFGQLFEGCSEELVESLPWNLAKPQDRYGVPPLEFALRNFAK